MTIEYAVIKLTSVGPQGILADSWYIELRLVDGISSAREQVGKPYTRMIDAYNQATFLAKGDGAQVVLPCRAC